MSFASLISSLGGKNDSLTYADTYCRVNEFENTDNYGAIHVTGDHIGHRAEEELKAIFAQLNAAGELDSPILVSYFDKTDKDGVRRRGALVYAKEGKEPPLLYCRNALLGYSGSGVGVSQMILDYVGLFSTRSATTFASLQAKAKRQRSQSHNDAYSVTVVV